MRFGTGMGALRGYVMDLTLLKRYRARDAIEVVPLLVVLLLLSMCAVCIAVAPEGEEVYDIVGVMGGCIMVLLLLSVCCCHAVSHNLCVTAQSLFNDLKTLAQQCGVWCVWGYLSEVLI